MAIQRIGNFIGLLGLIAFPLMLAGALALCIIL